MSPPHALTAEAQFHLGAVLALTGVFMLGVGPMLWFRAQRENASRD
ncbi:hypothetical protein AB0I28_21855 [Phytomonospora sp. NPDC050363]